MKKKNAFHIVKFEKEDESINYTGLIFFGHLQTFISLNVSQKEVNENSDTTHISISDSKESIGKGVLSLSILALLMYAGPIFGLIGTVFGMVSAFNRVAASGKPKAEELASDISIAMLTSIYGMLFVIPGAILILYIHKKRLMKKNWFYSWAIGLSIPWLLAFPIGSLIGGYMIYTLSKFYKTHRLTSRSKESTTRVGA